VGQQQPAPANDAPIVDGKLVSDSELVEAEFVMASRWFGENLKYVRERQSESQTGLATKMANLGFPFHQTTVSRIEVGERPVQLGEALALAKIIGIDVRLMIRRPSGVRLARLLTEATRRVSDDLSQIESYAMDAILAKIDLDGRLAAARDADLDDIELMDNAAGVLTKEPEDAVRDGRASAEQYLRQRTDDA